MRRIRRLSLQNPQLADLSLEEAQSWLDFYRTILDTIRMTNEVFSMLLSEKPANGNGGN